MVDILMDIMVSPEVGPIGMETVKVVYLLKNIMGLKIHEYFLIGSMVTREVMVFPEDN